MPLAKILLFYVFTPLADPDAIRLWQRDLAESLGLRGRILISKDGLNGTLGGEMGALKRYVRKTRDYAAFRRIDVKWSEGTGLDDDGRSLDFPKLSVKVRDEIVSFGAPGELRVDESGVVGGGTHPGSGLPVIYESARISSDMISRRFGIDVEPVRDEPFAKAFPV